MPRSLEDFADDRAKARFTENQEIARENRAMRTAITEKDRQIADLGKKLGLLEKLEDVKLNPPTWLRGKASTKRHAAIPTLLLSDVHWDEVVKPEQVDFVNAYNRPIAEQRLKRVFERTLTVSHDYLKGVEYEGSVLMLGGDLLSGIIHEELRETNEVSVMESIVSILEPLEAGIDLLSKELGPLHIVAVVGNHGRRTLKPIAKNRAQDNFDWLIYKLIERDYRGHKNVTITVSEAADAHVQIYGISYLLTHGDQFHGGTGISGALAPLLLGTHRKTRRQAAAGRPFDIMVMGHFHQSIWFPAKGIIVGGSVIGYNEYAYQQNLEPEAPQCSFWLTTPERGVTVSAPIFVMNREEEGW